MKLGHPKDDLDEHGETGDAHPQGWYSGDLDLGIFSKSLIRISLLLVSTDCDLKAYHGQLRLLGD